MTTTYELTEAQYDTADAIELWLENHPGLHSPSTIARGIKDTNTVAVHNVLRWMESNVFVDADGNGCRRKYGSRR
jgi:hypothetical protein